MLFQMMHSILLSVFHLKTILLVDHDWALKVFHQSAVGVLKGNTVSKMEHTTWKSNENWTEKWCQIVCSILFDLFLCMTSSGPDLLWQRFSSPPSKVILPHPKLSPRFFITKICYLLFSTKSLPLTVPPSKIIQVPDLLWQSFTSYYFPQNSLPLRVPPSKIILKVPKLLLQRYASYYFPQNSLPLMGASIV